MTATALLFAETADGWTPWLETTGVILLAIGLVLGCLAAWITNLIALPGNWICVLLIALYAWLGPATGRLAIGYGPVLAGFALALVGELFEFFAGAAGAKRAGASRKSTLYSIIGSMAGAITGAVVGVPVPVVGSVIAAILFGGIGAAAGAMYGEWSDGRSWKENWSVGHSTFWGRTFGTLGKVLAGLLIVILVLAAVLI
ncbi:DUF456 family protein [Stieleria sp. ICT_E10.1]|uniref:DUF456 family protein n=1 Tax=Stieleria sedimenti TaxID=2976331 RepID=UPI00218014EE|nr:DUF456 family protein [Stieleria sedimenti]MCS7468180.1 DUF456 family protein [Stieleria sedimenti]